MWWLIMPYSEKYSAAGTSLAVVVVAHSARQANVQRCAMVQVRGEAMLHEKLQRSSHYFNMQCNDARAK